MIFGDSQSGGKKKKKKNIKEKWIDKGANVSYDVLFISVT